MPKLNFYDLREKKSFSTDQFELVKLKNGSFQAIAISPAGNEVRRFVSKAFFDKYEEEFG